MAFSAVDKVFTVRGFEAERRSIPLPIQTYFWRQTSQMLKSKLVKRTYESACVSFERVICDNRILDLQTTLAGAVNSIPRWHFIQSSLPYILQCCSALLASRTTLGNIERFGNAEKCLLYTLHWILVEAPSVCNVTEDEELLFPLTTVEQLVHLLVPHVHTIREDDLTFRLENGYPLWHALWRHGTPPFTPFQTAVIHKEDADEAQSTRCSAMMSDEPDEFSAASFFDVAVLKCLCSSGWSEEGIVWGLLYLAEYLQREFHLPENEARKEADKIKFKVEYLDPSENVVKSETRSRSNSPDTAGRSPKNDERKDDGKQESTGRQLDAGDDRLPPSALERAASTKLRVKVHSSPVLANGGRVFAAVTSSGEDEQNRHVTRDEKALSDSAVFSNTKVVIRPASPQSTEGEAPGRPQAGEPRTAAVAPVTDASSPGGLGNSSTPASRVTSGQTDKNNAASVTPLPVSVKLGEAEKTTVGPETDAALPQSSAAGDLRTQAESRDTGDGAGGPERDANPVRASHASSRGSFLRTEKYRVFPGAAEYITNDGRLSTTVILQALNGLVTEQPTARVCDAVMKVFHCLVKINEKHKHKRRDSVWGADDRTVAETQAIGFRSPHSENILGRLRASFYGRPPSFQSLSMGCTFSLIKALGCPLGCAEGCGRGTTGHKVREQTNQLLAQLLSDDPAITSCLLQYAKLEPVENQLDFLHALLAFCEDTQEYSDGEGEGDRPKGTLFGVPEGVEGRIVRGLFPTLVARVADMNYEDLKNVTFYGEVRLLLNYVKDNFGGVFWEVALRGLLDSICKEPTCPGQPQHRGVDTPQGGTPLRRVSSSVKDDTPKGKRHFLFHKIGRGTGGGAEGDSATTPPLSGILGLDASVPEVTMSPRSKRKIFTLGSWRKQKTVGALCSSDDEFLEFADSPDAASSSSRGKSSKQKGSGRKRIEDVFPVKVPHRAPAEGSPSLPAPLELRRRLVDLDGLRAGMFRFRFLLNGTQPGSVPDPKIVASMLDLDAPVVSRACLLLECAHLVHRCNKREWPRWLRGSLPYQPAHRRAVAAKRRNTFMFTHRRSLLAMHAAGRLFHAWGVALGLKLQYLARKEQGAAVSGEDGSEKLRHEESAFEEIHEDFLDEATVKDTCPYALKMVACQLLLEITAFLSETQAQISFRKETAETPFQRRAVTRKRQNSGFRRRSTANAPEPSSRFSGYFGGGAEKIRKASIMSQTSVVLELNARRSLYGAPVITVSGEPAERKGDGLLGPQTSASLFVRRGSNRLSKTHGAVGGEAESLRHRTSRRASRSHRFSTTEGDVDDEDDDSDEEWLSKFPWLHAIVQLNSATRWVCQHQGACPCTCYLHQRRGCSRLTRALKVVYAGVAEKPDKEDRARGDRGSTVTGGSPLISSPQSGVPSSENKGKMDTPNEEMLGYIATKVSGLTHCPLSVIAKAGVVVETSLLKETLPISWELLLCDDQQLVSAAAAVFLLTGVRMRRTVEELLHTQLTSPHADDRMTSLLRYEVLWHSRYHAWPRLKEGARQDFKIPPTKIDFTLPSPAVGTPTEQVPDCPWNPFLMLEEQQSLKEKEKKKVTNLPDEEQSRQRRSVFLLRTVPVSLDATAGVSTNDEEKAETAQVDGELWPPAVSAAVPDVIRMMDDVLVDKNRTAVMEAAVRVVWTCLVNDPVLFFRTILEQMTQKNHQEEMVLLLRKLLLFGIRLPPTSSRFLVNNLIGVAMFYARTNKPGTQDSVALVLSVLWELVPSVRGFYFKDLKQCLKKEFIDAALRVSANVPGAKRLAVTLAGQESTLERVPVHEEMTFGKVLSYYKARLNLHDSDLYLVDKRSNQILEERLHVRDLFQYRKGFPSPQLLLERMEYAHAFSRRQEQAFTAKLSDIGRILLSTAILRAQPSQKHVQLLHDEFSRQFSFPRKALDCDFELYSGGTKGKELAALDVIHKSYWVKLICLLFDCMPSDFPWGGADLHLFLNVLNGAVLLHCEDTALLRLCLASYINVAVHFSHIFSTDGYQCIFPSLVQVYSHHQSNRIVLDAIEFTLCQLYTLHQKPCLLQLLASVAPKLLENKLSGEPGSTENRDNKIPPKCLFSLLVSLDAPTKDVLDILGLVKAEKPLRPIDSCYDNTVDLPGDSKMDDVIRLCVMVVNFAPESKRAVQMVVVLSAILPHYIDYLKCDSSGAGALSEDKMKKELAGLTSLATSMQVLVKSCEVLTRSFMHFQSYKSLSDKTSGVLADLPSTTVSVGPYLGRESFGSVDAGDDSDAMRSRPLLERIRAQEEKDEALASLQQFRTPRDALLLLVSEYIRLCGPRVRELRRILPPRLSAPELLDGVCITTVTEIAYALLKVAVYDPATLSSPGVHRYMLEALPAMEGPADVLESALHLILKRTQKMFQKLVSKPSLARCIDWKSLEVFLDGIYMVLCKHKHLASSQHLKSVVTECMCLVLEERSVTATSVGAGLPFAPFFAPPQSFCGVVVKLASRLMFELRAECSLRELCGGVANFGSPARTEKVLVGVLLPLLIRLGSGRQGAPRASAGDAAFALTCFLQVITTRSSSSHASGPVRLSLADNDVDLTRTLAFVRPHLRGASTEAIPDVLYRLAYLGIKLLMVCFEDLLSNEWYRIYQALEMVAETAICGVAFWDFLHFVVSYRTPLFLIMMPVISTKIIHVPHTNNTERALKQRIIGKLQRPPPVVSCRNVNIRRFLEDIAESKNPRTSGNEGDADEEQDDAGLVLKSPPPGRKPDAADAAGTFISKLKRAGSQRNRKAVTFLAPPSEADSKNAPTASGSSEHSKRTRHVLRKQDSFETVEGSLDNAGDADSGTGPSRLGHQRGVTLKGRNPFSKPGKKAGMGRFRAVASRVMREAEHKKSGDTQAAASNEKRTDGKAVEMAAVVLQKAPSPSPTSTPDDQAPMGKVLSTASSKHARTTAGNKLTERAAGTAPNQGAAARDATPKDSARARQDANGLPASPALPHKAREGRAEPTRKAARVATPTNGVRERQDANGPPAGPHKATEGRAEPTRDAADNKSKPDAPIATPESLSPSTSMDARADSPVDVLRMLRPEPPGSPVKSAEFFVESTNGSVTSKMTSPHDLERDAQLSKTRMLHQVSVEDTPHMESAVFVRLVPEKKICSSLSEPIPTQQAQNDGENQRETNV